MVFEFDSRPVHQINMAEIKIPCLPSVLVLDETGLLGRFSRPCFELKELPGLYEMCSGSVRPQNESPSGPSAPLESTRDEC